MIILGKEVTDIEIEAVRSKLIALIELNTGVSYEDSLKEGCDMARAIKALPDTGHLERIRRFEATDGPWLYDSVVRTLREMGCPVAV